MEYGILFEVGGEFGMFADRFTGSEMTSFPFPPPTACIGIAESILWFKWGVKLKAKAVGVCHMPRWAPFNYNSHTSLRKKDLIRKEAACQIRETVLCGPRFQILMVAQNYDAARFGNPTPEKIKFSSNRAHSYQEQFFRRLSRNQSYHSVYLGRKEMLCNYVGMPITPIVNFNTIIPSMQRSEFNNFGKVRQDEERESIFNLEVKDGVVMYDDGVVVRDGKLGFADPELQRRMEEITTRIKNND